MKILPFKGVRGLFKIEAPPDLCHFRMGKRLLFIDCGIPFTHLAARVQHQKAYNEIRKIIPTAHLIYLLDYKQFNG